MRGEPRLHWESYREEVEARALGFSERRMGEDRHMPCFKVYSMKYLELGRMGRTRGLK